jgi:catechol 2,3-dioxygenase-like lactoylglutathione lyase family enzyme
MIDPLKKEVCATVDRLAPELLHVSHEIHAHPELAFEEVRASRLLAETARARGLDAHQNVYGLETAIEARFGAAGPTVALLSEYDALPGIGHACGHNIIATSALGAALALAELGARLPGRVRWLGTPAEERGGGKEIMARNGAFEGVDAALMVHPSGANLATMPCLAIAELEVTYFGVASHASAMPERGVNALDALVLAYQGIAALRQHIRPTERLHGIITDGGQAPNIVPERAAGRFYVRAANAGELAAGAGVGRGRLSRPRHVLAAREPLSGECGVTGPHVLSLRQAPAGCAGQHRHGQRESARAVDPSDDRVRAAERLDSQCRVREVGRLGAGRPGGARRREGARHDRARLPLQRVASRRGRARVRRIQARGARMSGPRLSLVLLEVADLERSLHFYRDLLGLPLHLSKHETGDDRWISGDHAAVSWNGGSFLHFALYRSKRVVTRDVQIGFPTDELDDTHQRLVAAGVVVDHAPREEPWGRTARYRDPDGNSVSLTESKPR